jgi:hypothetical protein
MAIESESLTNLTPPLFVLLCRVIDVIILFIVSFDGKVAALILADSAELLASISAVWDWPITESPREALIEA